MIFKECVRTSSHIRMGCGIHFGLSYTVSLICGSICQLKQYEGHLFES